MTWKVYVIGGLYLLLSVASFAQRTNTDSLAINAEFLPRLRSLQVDGSTCLFSFNYGGSVDPDVAILVRGDTVSLGFRAGFEGYGWGDVGGGGQSFEDYYSLLRLTIPKKHWRLDMLAGFALHRQLTEPHSPFLGTAKYGIEARWKIVPGFCGLFLKASWLSNRDMTGGIGLYLGWDQ
jgi:hypothetical protein